MIGRGEQLIVGKHREGVTRVRDGPCHQTWRLADQLEHLRFAEPHVGDRASQHIEDLVNVEGGAFPPVERGGAQQAPSVFGGVAPATVPSVPYNQE